MKFVIFNDYNKYDSSVFRILFKVLKYLKDLQLDNSEFWSKDALKNFR